MVFINVIHDKIKYLMPNWRDSQIFGVSVFPNILEILLTFQFCSTGIAEIVWCLIAFGGCTIFMSHYRNVWRVVHTTCLLIKDLKESIYFYIFIYLLESQIYKEEERQRRSSIWWFTPQVNAPADAMPIRSQEPEISSGYPTWVQGPKALGQPQQLPQAKGRELDGKWNCWD